MFSLTRTTAGAFAVPYKVLSHKKSDEIIRVFLELVPLRGEIVSNHAHKAGAWYLVGILFKISVAQPRSFYMGNPLALAAYGTLGNDVQNSKSNQPVSWDTSLVRSSIMAVEHSSAMSSCI